MADRPVVVVGAGGHGREAHEILRSAGREVAGFVDDGDVAGEALERLRRLGTVLLGTTDDLPTVDADVVVAIGAGAVRLDVSAAVEQHPGVRIAAAAVHAAATVGAGAELEAGVLVGPGARLTTEVRLGRHAHVGANAVLGHDVVLEEGASVYPGAVLSGAVQVGRAATVGAGATVLPGRRIGAGATVGAGAVVTRDVAPWSVVAGVPARGNASDATVDLEDAPR